MKNIRTALCALGLCAIASLSALHARAATDSLTIDLAAQNGSGETGSAALTQKPEGVQIVITLANGTADAQPAHVHLGTCGGLNPSPQYPLTSVVNGNSTTVLKDVTIDQLLAAPSAINVHKSTSDLGTYVACGNIKSSS